ncbi:MAG: hypothetical protein Q9183_005210 [Haloplaca sp. 2 TL-2023]
MDLLNGLLSGAGGGGAGGFSSAGSSFLDALTTAGSDLGALSGQLDAIELTSFSGGQLTEIQGAQGALRSAREGLLKLIPGVRTTLSRPGPYAKTAFAGVLASLVANEVAMQALIYHEGSPTKASQAAKPPTASPTASPSSEPTSWIFNTRVGTSRETFDKFIKSLPDKGSGRPIIYPSMDYQWYVTRMTREEAMVVHQASIVDQLVSNRPSQPQLHFLPGNATANDYLAPRVNDPLRISSIPSAEPNLKQLSWHLDQPVPNFGSNDPQWNYLFENSLGKGKYIYVFDSKINWNHLEFSHQPDKQTHVPKQFIQPGVGDTTTPSDIQGHGSSVAGLAAGLRDGVAPQATLVSIVTMADPYMTNAQLLRDAVVDAWEWAVDDVNNRGRKEQAVFVMSVSYPFVPDHRRPKPSDPRYARWKLPSVQYDDYWLPLLVKAWESDIPTVFSGMNNPNSRIGFHTPQRYGTTDNAVITMGSLQADGRVWTQDTPEGPHPAGYEPHLIGHRDAYALTENVKVVDGSTNNAGYRLSGASSAAPQAAGLIAYWMSLPQRHRPRWYSGRVAASAKRFLVSRTRQQSAGSPDRLGAIYNGARELLCEANREAGIPRKERRADDMFRNATEAALTEKLLAMAINDPVGQWS